MRWEWLLDGIGEPWLTPKVEVETDIGGRPPNNLRSWREYNGFTIAQLAKKSGLGAQTITELESGASDLSSKLLNALAPALNTTPGYILDHDPDEIDPKFLDALRSIPKDRRVQALEILKTFRPYSKQR